VPGIKSSADAERLATELAFAAGRLKRLAEAPPGLYAEVAAPGDVEERIWLAFLIAYLSPLETADPFEAVRTARTTWASGEPPLLEGVATGPRAANDPAPGPATIDAYRAWVARSGSQAAAFAGEAAWTPERRFARVYERLALRGMRRDARFDRRLRAAARGPRPRSLQLEQRRARHARSRPRRRAGRRHGRGRPLRAPAFLTIATLCAAAG
jgi:hypothetical protein